MDKKNEMIIKYIRATLNVSTEVQPDVTNALHELRDVLDEADPLYPVLTTLLAEGECKSQSNMV